MSKFGLAGLWATMVINRKCNNTCGWPIKNIPSASAAISALIFLVAPTLATATEFECRAGQDVRYVRVDYPGINHLCEVSVPKAGEPREVKWYADVESTFCSRKIDELVGKYVNLWGYSCDEWPDHDGIDDLSPRQRKFLDGIVKENRSTKLNKEQYTLLGTRALTNSFTPPGVSKPNSLLAVQLFLGLVKQPPADQSSSTPTKQTDDKNLSITNRLILLTRFTRTGKSIYRHW